MSKGSDVSITPGSSVSNILRCRLDSVPSPFDFGIDLPSFDKQKQYELVLGYYRALASFPTNSATSETSGSSELRSEVSAGSSSALSCNSGASSISGKGGCGLGLKIARMGNGTCYLRAVKPEYRQACKSFLGIYPTLGQLVEAPVFWFFSEEVLVKIMVDDIYGEVCRIGDVGDVNFVQYLRMASKSRLDCPPDSLGGLFCADRPGSLSLRGKVGAKAVKRVQEKGTMVEPENLVEVEVDGVDVQRVDSGYCYLTAVNPQYRSCVKRKLGLYPTIVDLMSLPEDMLLCQHAMNSVWVVQSKPGFSHMSVEKGGRPLMDVMRAAVAMVDGPFPPSSYAHELKYQDFASPVFIDGLLRELVLSKCGVSIRDGLSPKFLASLRDDTFSNAMWYGMTLFAANIKPSLEDPILLDVIHPSPGGELPVQCGSVKCERIGDVNCYTQQIVYTQHEDYVHFPRPPMAGSWLVMLPGQGALKTLRFQSGQFDASKGAIIRTNTEGFSVQVEFGIVVGVVALVMWADSDEGITLYATEHREVVQI